MHGILENEFILLHTKNNIQKQYIPAFKHNICIYYFEKLLGWI